MGKITYNSTDWLGHWFYSHVFEKRPPIFPLSQICLDRAQDSSF